MHRWREIESFPGYSVSSQGLIQNDHTGRILKQSVNQYDSVNVGLRRGGREYKRSVSLLVANAFMPVRQTRAFDTPINLDGERQNNCIENLRWRPRWFAVRYFRQFDIIEFGVPTPVEDVDSGEQFATSWEAAITYGLLDLEIRIATSNREPVFPTFQRFRWLG